MAVKPVFFVSDNKPFFEDIIVEYKYFSGNNIKQKKRSINSLHASVKQQFPNAKILEISTKSENPLGVAMSAFNLEYTMENGDCIPFESVFQGSKVFENGKTYNDLYFVSPSDAKKDKRIRESGKIIAFELEGETFPTEPKTFFYDWMYVNSMSRRPELWEELSCYNAFTDIEFNHKKSINCQARSAAIFVSLLKNNLLSFAIQNQQKFKQIVYDMAEDDKKEEILQLRERLLAIERERSTGMTVDELDYYLDKTIK